MSPHSRSGALMTGASSSSTVPASKSQAAIAHRPFPGRDSTLNARMAAGARGGKKGKCAL